MNQNFVNYLQILVVLSPLFVTVFLIAVLLKRGLDKARKYSIFWLISNILLSAIFIYLVLRGERFTFNQALLPLIISNGWTTYYILKEKENEKK